MAGVILAGGAARRMGGLDKPLLRLDGVTLLERIIGLLRPQTSCLALSANGDPARYAAFGLPVLADTIPDLGPLAGVLRGIEWARAQACDALLTVPGDTPFIPPDLTQLLRPAPAVAASNGRIHHAVALWPLSCHGALQAYLVSGGNRSVVGFARTLHMREVAFAVAAADPFFNINTPDELRLAEDLAQPRRSGPDGRGLPVGA